jgi:hypothetical protein
MSQTHIRTFLVASAAFLALEAGPVVASLVVRQATAAPTAVQAAGVSEFPRTWMPGQLFDFASQNRSRRDCD